MKFKVNFKTTCFKSLHDLNYMTYIAQTRLMDYNGRDTLCHE